MKITPQVLLNNLTEVVNEVHKQPSPDDLCQTLATTVCVTGELCRVYLGRLDKDGVIRTESSFGYSLDSGVEAIETPLDFDRPMPFALRNRRVYFANRSEVISKFKKYEPLDMKSPWEATAVVPTSGTLVFVFRFQKEFMYEGWEESYFTGLQAIFNMYNLDAGRRNSLGSSAVVPVGLTSQTRRNIEKGKALTARQAFILSLIKEKKTNIQIAAIIGYSESLVRHETIIIYAKLGVVGRRELYTENLSGSITQVGA